MSVLKERLRAPLLAARRAQLATPSVRSFLRRMVARRRFGGRSVSVLDLVDRGDDLAARLAEAAARPEPQRDEALAGLVRPVLQVATASAAAPSPGWSSRTCGGTSATPGRSNTGPRPAGGSNC